VWGGSDRSGRPAICRLGGGAQRVGRGADHSRIDNVEVGDNNGRLAQDTQEPSSSILLIYKVQFLLLCVIR
jgi:hypothetical protein